jgi:hypothetical protein
LRWRTCCFACAAETDKWKKISFVFLPVVGLYMGFVAVRHNSHGHHEYEQVRAAAYHPSPPPCLDRAIPWILPCAADARRSACCRQVKYPFVKKRDKPMPWALAGGSDCDLFDYKCGAAYKAAKAAAAE